MAATLAGTPAARLEQIDLAGVAFGHDQAVRGSRSVPSHGCGSLLGRPGYTGFSQWGGLGGWGRPRAVGRRVGLDGRPRKRGTRQKRGRWGGL
ncbi:MAG: hypothetical protein ABSF03_22245 [Streptosporangiaceae bacterium]